MNYYEIWFDRARDVQDLDLVAALQSYLDYLRGAYAGKSSSTHFKKAIGVREKELEAAWHAYAASRGR